nr:unnamed protein product [Digitaria exilis]
MTSETGLREDIHLVGERKHSKSPDGGKTDSSGSFRTSDDEAREKDERYFISEEKNGCEAQTILEKKTDEERKLCSRVDDLESQLNKEKDDCQRMTSKTKKLIKAHGRYIKAKEDLKRSQARFEREATERQ